MEKHLDHIAAWDDFWIWIKEQPVWSDKDALPTMQKRYLYKAKWARDKGHLGRERVKNILEKYAPTRYDFREIVVLNGELMPSTTKKPRQNNLPGL